MILYLQHDSKATLCKSKVAYFGDDIMGEKNATFDVTNKCNLRCAHCYNYSEYLATKNCPDLTLEECKKILYKLKESGYTSISLLGGEPFYRKDIFDILSTIKYFGMKSTVTTNGTFLTESSIAKLAEVGLNTLIVSVDGYCASEHDSIRGTGVFEKITAGLLNLSKEELKFNVIISHVITELNFRNLYKMVDLCLRYKIKQINIFPIMKAGNGSANWEKYKNNIVNYLDSIDEMICYAKNIYPELHITIESRPSLVLYFKLKYSANIHYLLGYTKCQADNGFVFVDAKGIIHNCGLYKLDAGKDALNKKILLPNTLVYSEFDKITDFFNTKESEMFFQSKFLLRKKDYTVFCGSCLYKDDCYPCPFQFNDGVPECEVLYPLIQEEIDRLLNSKIIFRSVKRNEWILKNFDDIYSLVDTYNSEIRVSEIINDHNCKNNRDKLEKMVKLRDMESFFLVKIK